MSSIENTCEPLVLQRKQQKKIAKDLPTKSSKMFQCIHSGN